MSDLCSARLSPGFNRIVSRFKPAPVASRRVPRRGGRARGISAARRPLRTRWEERKFGLVAEFFFFMAVKTRKRARRSRSKGAAVPPTSALAQRPKPFKRHAANRCGRFQPPRAASPRPAAGWRREATSEAAWARPSSRRPPPPAAAARPSGGWCDTSRWRSGTAPSRAPTAARPSSTAARRRRCSGSSTSPSRRTGRRRPCSVFPTRVGAGVAADCDGARRPVCGLLREGGADRLRVKHTPPLQPPEAAPLPLTRQSAPPPPPLAISRDKFSALRPI